jgi:hypothetical protein
LYGRLIRESRFFDLADRLDRKKMLPHSYYVDESVPGILNLRRQDDTFGAEGGYEDAPKEGLVKAARNDLF